MPTTFDVMANHASTALRLPHVAGDGVLSVYDASKFVAPTRVTLYTGNGPLTETVHCILAVTAVDTVGNTLTVSGAVEGTTDASLPIATRVELRGTAGQWNALTAAMNTLQAGALTPPGGSSGQIQFNSSGGFAGVAGSSVDSSGNVLFDNSVTVGSGYNLNAQYAFFSGYAVMASSYIDQINANTFPRQSYITMPGGFTVNTGGASNVGAVFKGYTSQLNDYIQCQDVNGNVVSSINGNGNIAANGQFEIKSGAASGIIAGVGNGMKTYAYYSLYLEGLRQDVSDPTFSSDYTSQHVQVKMAQPATTGLAVQGVDTQTADFFECRTYPFGTSVYGIDCNGAPHLPTLDDATAKVGSVYLGSDHLDGSGDPKLCRKTANGVTVIG